MQIIPKRFSPTRRRFRLAWLAVISLVSAGSADPAPKDDSIPTDLKISAGTFFGAKFTLELRDGMNSGSDSTYADFTSAVSALIDEPFY